MYTQEQQDLVLQHFLTHIPQHGWTLEALKKAVLDAGYKDGDQFRFFRGNLDTLLEYYFDMLDRQTVKRLDEVDLSSMRTKDRVATALMLRLRMLNKDKEIVRKIASYAKHPARASIILKARYNTVSTFWYAAGDKSTDFNFYTKRTLLAAVYSATFHYWLNDDSEDNIKTRAYLSRRLDQVMKIPKLKARLTDGFDILKKKMGA